MRDELRRHYGPDADLIEERRRAAVRLLESAAEELGPERRVILCRAPGRANLMGRHVDHRGGYVNVMAISREVLLAASPRDDDTITLRNVDEARFPRRRFRISEILDQAHWSSWAEFIDSGPVREALDAAPADWSHYARAPLLRLQHENGRLRLKGMDCVVSGNIPMGAGLSSSSALVVAFAEAAVALNGLDVAPRDFVDLCGEGEWFVGSRGGSADHAAIHTGRLGHISRVGFLPFRVERQVPLPPDVDVVIADSGEKAVKSAGAGQVFNQRVACYNVAEILLRRSWPAARAAEHLRDFVPDRLGVAAGEIFSALSRLPERPSRRAVRRMLAGEDQATVERIFAAHANLGCYDLRGVTLYGIAECMRSDRFADAIAHGNLDLVGRLMRASHDGDRRKRWTTNGSPRRHLVRTDAATLAKLAANDADLTFQPGRYACSTEAVDRLVDVADGAEGVIGAQLAGAGLGGCMMALVKSDSTEILVERLRETLDQQGQDANGVYLCRPVAGAGLLGV